jgi:CRISPR type III-A-associated RAMP protein Csm5
MKTCRVTTLTAVHTGSGRNLQKDTEFIIDKTRAAVIDDRKVLEVIGKGNIDKWIACINKGSGLMDLIRTIKSDVELDDIALRGMDLYASNITNSRSLKEQMLSGGDIPLIPGSSIKGSIRTAILNELLGQFQKMPFRHEDIFNRREKIDDKAIIKKYFGDSPNNDLLRFLTIGDALFDFETWACNVLIMNIVKSGVRMEAKLGQLTECIPAGVETEIRLNINETQLSLNIGKNYLRNHTFFLNNYTYLFDLINSHTGKTIKQEIEFWDDDINDGFVSGYLKKLQLIENEISDCQPRECVLRVGHGSGWLGMTGGWAKNDKYIADRKIWDAIEDKSRPNNKRNYSDYPFPKSRRMDDEGELLGFIKLTLLE